MTRITVRPTDDQADRGVVVFLLASATIQRLGTTLPTRVARCLGTSHLLPVSSHSHRSFDHKTRARASISMHAVLTTGHRTQSTLHAARATRLDLVVPLSETYHRNPITDGGTAEGRCRRPARRGLPSAELFLGLDIRCTDRTA